VTQCGSCAAVQSDSKTSCSQKLRKETALSRNCGKYLGNRLQDLITQVGIWPAGTNKCFQCVVFKYFNLLFL